MAMNTQRNRHDDLPAAFPHPNIPPSSPPASPPRYQRNHSNSLSQSLTESFDPSSAEAKSILLASSVLRSYPPALQGTSSRHHRFNHTAAPPSPPESLILSQSVRQSRSTSTVTNPMPTASPALQPAAVIEPLSFRERLNIALPFRRSKQVDNQRGLEPAHGHDFLDRTPSLTLTTTHSPSQSLPTTAQHSADTAQTSLYSNTFPIPCYTDFKAPSSDAGTDDSFDIPTYYNRTLTHSKEPDSLISSRRQSERQSGRQSGTLGDGEPPRTVIIRGGEVRVDIKRPSSTDDQEGPNFSRHLKADEQSTDSYSRHGVSGSAIESSSYQGERRSEEWNDDESEELFEGNPIDYQRCERDSIPIQSAGLCIKGLQHRKALKDLKHPSYNSIAKENEPLTDAQRKKSVLTFSDSEFGEQSSDYYLDEAVDYFTNYDPDNQGENSQLATTNTSSAGFPAFDTPDRNNANNAPGELTPAKASSAVLNDSSISSLNKPSNSSPSRLQRPGAGSRYDTSSPASPARVRSLRRPPLDRNPTTQTHYTTNTTSSSMDINQAENAVRSMGAELGKRLSGMSSSAGSNPSRSGSVKSTGFGAGLAVVITADGNGALSDVRSRLFEIQDEDVEGRSKRDGGSRTSGKGKGRMEEGSVEGGGSSQSEKERETSTYESEAARDISHIKEQTHQKQRSITVHPGDDRFDYVYRLRAASPDNQPILVPHYKYPAAGSFPNRNAFTVPKPVKVEPTPSTPLKKQPALASLRHPKARKSKDDDDSIQLPEPIYSRKGRSLTTRAVVGVGGDGAGDLPTSGSLAEDRSLESNAVPPEGVLARFVASSTGIFTLGSGKSTTSNPYSIRDSSRITGSSIADYSESAQFNSSPPLPPSTSVGPRGGGNKGRRAFYTTQMNRDPMDIIYSDGSLSTPEPALHSQHSFRSLRNLGRRFFRYPSPHLYRTRTVDQKALGNDLERGVVQPYPMTDEALEIQKKLSRMLFACCLIFPPTLLVLGYGGMDALILQLSKGEVETVGPFEKRLALWTGFISGAAVIGVVIGAVIVVSLA